MTKKSQSQTKKTNKTEKKIIDFDEVLKNNMDKRLKVMAIKDPTNNHDHDVDIDHEMSEVIDFFKEKVPTLSLIVSEFSKFNKARKSQDMAQQITSWNKFLTKFIEFDLAFELTGEKIRKISNELVNEAETLDVKSDIFKDIEDKSEII